LEYNATRLEVGGEVVGIPSLEMGNGKDPYTDLLPTGWPDATGHWGVFYVRPGEGQLIWAEMTTVETAPDCYSARLVEWEDGTQTLFFGGHHCP
jgi:hypothetical protein